MNILLFILTMTISQTVNKQIFNQIKDCNNWNCVTKILDKNKILSRRVIENDATEYRWINRKTYHSIIVIVNPDSSIKEIRYKEYQG